MAEEVAMQDDAGEEDTSDEEGYRLPWEPEEVQLPQELQTCLKRVLAGHKLPLAPVLSEVPVFQGLKQRAEDNNHGQDGKSMADKWLNALLQRLLNLARMQEVEYACLQ